MQKIIVKLVQKSLNHYNYNDESYRWVRNLHTKHYVGGWQVAHQVKHEKSSSRAVRIQVLGPFPTAEGAFHNW